MDQTQMRCMCCGMLGTAPATTTIKREIDSARVTVEGVPGLRCTACGAIGTEGKVMIPIDAAITDILVAAGVASRPTPEEEAALREENRAFARSLGQEDTFVDEPASVPS